MPFFFMIPFLGCFFVSLILHSLCSFTRIGSWRRPTPVVGLVDGGAHVHLQEYADTHAYAHGIRCAHALAHIARALSSFIPRVKICPRYFDSLCAVSLSRIVASFFRLVCSLIFAFTRHSSFAQRSFPGCLMPHFFRSTGVSHPNLLDQCRLSVGQLLDA